MHAASADTKSPTTNATVRSPAPAISTAPALTPPALHEAPAPINTRGDLANTGQSMAPPSTSFSPTLGAKPQPAGNTPAQQPSSSASIGALRTSTTVSAAGPAPDAATAQAFLDAARSGHKAVRELKDSGRRINAKDAHGHTALHFAAMYGDFDAVETLLENKASIDAVNSGLMTPLMIAARSGNAAIVGCLLEAGANANCWDCQDNSPLGYAAEGGDTSCIRLLLTKTADPRKADKGGQTPLHRAARHGHRDAIDMLLDKGLPIDAQDKQGNTPFLLAASANHLPALALLRERGCNTAAHNETGCSVYSEAVGSLNVPLLELLVEWKLPIGRDQALSLVADAAMLGAGDVMLQLRRLGAELQPVNWHLFEAIARDHGDVVIALLKGFGADANAKHDNGQTALWMAVELNRPGCVRVLLDHGARLNNDAHAQPLLCAAVEKGHAGCVETLLQQHPVDLSTVTPKLQTPLMLAASLGHLDIARSLCAAGFDVNFAPPGQAAPIELAALAGHASLVAMLLDKGARCSASLLQRVLDRNDVATADVLLISGEGVDKTELKPETGLANAALFDLLLHARQTFGSSETPPDRLVLLGTDPGACIADLARRHASADRDVAAWLGEQGLRAVLWPDFLEMLHALHALIDSGCLGSPGTREQAVRVACAVLLARFTPQVDASVYTRAGIGATTAKKMEAIASWQPEALRKTGLKWLEQHCLADIAQLSQRCLTSTSLIFVPAATLAQEWMEKVGLLPPVAQRVADCWALALRRVLNEGEFSGKLSQLRAVMAEKLGRAFAAEFRSPASTGSFYASTSADAPQAYHDLIVTQLYWIQQACDAMGKAAGTGDE